MPINPEEWGKLIAYVEDLKTGQDVILENLAKRDEYCRQQNTRLTRIEARSGLFGLIGGFMGGLIHGRLGAP